MKAGSGSWAITSIRISWRGPYFRRLSPAFAREELEQILPADELDKPVRELSGGMRRRVSIVRAVAVPSDLLVMDEPFTGLDPETRQKAIDYILRKKGDKPFVITSHETEGLDFCRRIPIHPELEN